MLVIVAALGIAGVLAGELYARNRANTIVAQVTSCVVEDEASASFGVVPPFLWQHARKKYTNISIETAGNQVRDAKGMTVNIDIEDVQLAETANSGGTIGSLVATITWTAEGIKETVQGAIPLFGGIVSDVQTNTNDGTIELRGGLGSITAKPRIDEEGWPWTCSASAGSVSPCRARPCSPCWTPSPRSSPRATRWASTPTASTSPIPV